MGVYVLKCVCMLGGGGIKGNIGEEHARALQQLKMQNQQGKFFNTKLQFSTKYGYIQT